ncbi:MAG TPA: chromosome partitioning ATPase, partial [Rhodocyclaceae bacterium]|nr:chromosome partitioning ATPase [Rhodocyclaceae bacterium]
MDIIEQAAKRLAELRRAGVDVPEAAPAAEVKTVSPAPVAPAAASAPAPEPVVIQPAWGGNVSRRIELDMDAIGKRGIVTPQAERSQLAEELRVIKRPLLRNVLGKGVAPVKNGNLIMITSAVPGEGKSFTAA